MQTIVFGRPGVPIQDLLLLAPILLALVACAVTEDNACPVTIADGSTPPGESPSDLHHGNGELWTALWPEGKVIFKPGGPGEIREDGSLAMKFPWWRGDGITGQLEISGRGLEEDSSPLEAIIPDGYGDTGFQSTAIVFPSAGCWEITGRVGDAELTVIVLADRIDQ
jgi:hypothetical protein